MWRPDINVADSFFSKILPYINTKMALRAWKPSKGVAALGNRYFLKPQSIGSCESTLLFRGFGVLRLDNCSDARAGARAGARTGARVHGVLIRYFLPRGRSIRHRSINMWH